MKRRATLLANARGRAAARRAHLAPDGSEPDGTMRGWWLRSQGPGAQALQMRTTEAISGTHQDNTEVAFCFPPGAIATHMESMKRDTQAGEQLFELRRVPDQARLRVLIYEGGVEPRIQGTEQMRLMHQGIGLVELDLILLDCSLENHGRTPETELQVAWLY